MKLYTSNYHTVRTLIGETSRRLVSISHSQPDWFIGRKLKELSPPWSLVKGYSEGKITKEEYSFAYHLKVLRAIPVESIITKLNHEDVLLCYCHRNDFCHRQIVREWLKANVESLSIEELQRRATSC